MRQLILILLSILCYPLSATDVLRIGVITDTHYLSEKLMMDGKPLQSYIASGGRNVKVVPEVLDQVFDHYLHLDSLSILFISGDITKDGEKQSHIDFIERLKPLQDKGIKVFVIPGNHDVNMPYAKAYTATESLPTENVSDSQFASLYASCGYYSSLSRDRNSLSYIAELDDNTWLLAIDAARYDDYTATQSLSSGRIKPETEKWISEQLDRAKVQNKRVIGMMHWGLVEHIAYQSTLFANYLVDDWQRWAQSLADKGVELMFTGHFHANDITALTSPTGNTIYDIETATLSTYPFAYRIVDLYADSVVVKTKHVTSIASEPNLAEKDKIRMQAVAKRSAIAKLKGMGLDLPADVMNSLAEVVSELFILHVEGDEVMSLELRAKLKEYAKLLDAEMDVEDISLDLDPADNNVTIYF